MGRAERGQFAGSSQAKNRGTIEAEQKEVQRMNYPAGNPYQPYYPYPAPTAPVLRASAAPRYEIIHVTGRRGAEALQMAPNSSVHALDDTAPRPEAQDVGLLLRHRQGQGLTASANPSVKWRLKSDTQRTETRVMHKFVQTQKRANLLRTKENPQTQRFAGFPIIGGGGGSRTRSPCGKPLDITLFFCFVCKLVCKISINTR